MIQFAQENSQSKDDGVNFNAVLSWFAGSYPVFNAYSAGSTRLPLPESNTIEFELINPFNQSVDTIQLYYLVKTTIPASTSLVNALNVP